MSWTTEQRFETKRLHNLAVALWGACGGALVTLLLLLPGLGNVSNQAAVHLPNLPRVRALESASVIPWQEQVEKRMYLLNWLCCPVLAWLSLKLRSRINAWACLLSAVLFVPTIFNAYRGIFQGQPSLLAVLAAGLPLTLPAFVWIHRRHPDLGPRRPEEGQGIALPDETTLSRLFSPKQLTWSGKQSSLSRRVSLAVVLQTLLFVFFFPYPTKDYASCLSSETHLSSYLIGPSLSFLNPQLTPGLDFESHYGVGHAYVFSFCLGPSFLSSLCHYILFLFVILSFSYVSAFFVLSKFCGSESAAFLATVLLAAVGMEGMGYNWPSNWPIRHPFLFLFLGCAAQNAVLGRKWLAVAVAGFFAGLSTFWQTDIGLFLVLTGLVYYTVLTVRERRGFAQVPLFIVAASGTFVTLCLLAFGSRTLSLLFYQRLLAPLLVYNSGFGCWLMNWQPGWSYLYNVIGPVVTLATIGWCVKRFHSRNAHDQQEARFLFLCGVIGLLMLFKWVNRSIDPIWSINAVGIVIVLFWWVRQGTVALGEIVVTHFGDRSQASGHRLRILTNMAVIAVLLGMGVVASLFQTKDPMRGISSSPLVRITRFTQQTPTLANRLLRPGRSPLSADCNRCRSTRLTWN